MALAVHAGRGRGNNHNRLKSKMNAKGGFIAPSYGGRGGGGGGAGVSGGLAGNAGDGFNGGNSHHGHRRGCQGDVKKEKNDKMSKPPTIITDLANANGKGENRLFTVLPFCIYLQNKTTPVPNLSYDNTF